MGAIVTILSLAFGTFTQQLIAVQNVVVTNLNSPLLPGNIPRSENWTHVDGNPAEASEYLFSCAF
jgi:hypothetical protein